jgi:hypothetical protein
MGGSNLASSGGAGAAGGSGASGGGAATGAALFGLFLEVLLVAALGIRKIKFKFEAWAGPVLSSNWMLKI